MYSLERVLSTEERIRRAEEIYNRRRSHGEVRVNTVAVSSNSNKEYKLFKKLIIQILICLLIYFSFYIIKKSNYIFSENVINKAKEVLYYDINFNNLYNYCVTRYNEYIEIVNSIQNKNEIDNDVENDKEDTNNKENSENINENEIKEENEKNEENEDVKDNEENNQIGGIGGGNDESEIKDVSADEVKNEDTQTIQLSQMEIDANYIKENYSLILPLKGTITSRYGPRTPTAIVSANHGGIDIGVNEGTIFTAAMDGNVTLVSGEGSYRKSCIYSKWGSNNNICTL